MLAGVGYSDQEKEVAATESTARSGLSAALHAHLEEMMTTKATVELAKKVSEKVGIEPPGYGDDYVEHLLALIEKLCERIEELERFRDQGDR